MDRYEEALERAKQLLKTSVAYDRFTIEKIFPELKESENERIRKGMLQGFKDYGEPEYVWWEGVKVKECIAWLEKQGKQKELSQSKVTKISDQEWSDEDERNLKGIIDEIEANKNDAPDYDLATYDRFLFWLKSLKQRLQLQGKEPK